MVNTLVRINGVDTLDFTREQINFGTLIGLLESVPAVDCEGNDIEAYGLTACDLDTFTETMRSYV